MGLKDVWTVFETVRRLLQLEQTHGKSIDGPKQAVADLDRRLQRLENREDVVVDEAKAAARSASHEATQGAVADMARRLGRLEGDVATTTAATRGLSDDLAAALPAPERSPRKKREATAEAARRFQQEIEDVGPDSAEMIRTQRQDRTDRGG